MTYSYDPFGASRPRGRQSGNVVITPAEFQKMQQIVQELGARLEQELAKNKELQAGLDRQTKELHHTRQEVEIKDEALRRQSEHQKQLETEIVFVRAALAEAQERLAADPEEATWQERYARLQAEMDNLRKRWEQRSIDETAENRRRVLADMLPLADHLDLALQHQPQSDNVQVRNFVGNIDATRRAFLETLRRYGVERIEPTHQLFDPTRHEAIGQTPSVDVPADHVALVTQAGYAEGDRILRPARVIVSSGPATA
ncbi:MAG: nucleotide exchange factor GrpE [Caldilineaceae bacterium]|jgi:molecular chaperone GrpE|nr:nucleotide exchange factor GrpE [Caldilineaceae bacterium]